MALTHFIFMSLSMLATLKLLRWIDTLSGAARVGGGGGGCGKGNSVKMSLLASWKGI